VKYTERQISSVLIAIFIGVFVIISISYIYNFGNNSPDLYSILLTILIMVVGLLFFYDMKTYIDNEQILISFGIGLVKKRIAIKNIEKVTVVRNKWYYGFGIRMLKNGWLYNIKGLDAVELKMKNTKSIIRVGTADSQKLKREIERML